MIDLEKTLPKSTLKEAESIVSKYSVLLKPDEKYGFTGIAVELPTALGKGKTPDECYNETRSALVGIVAVMLRDGKKPPEPGSPPTRTVQLNIKFSELEEKILSSAANKLGFNGTSAFVRNLVLQAIPEVLR